MAIDTSSISFKRKFNYLFKETERTPFLCKTRARVIFRVKFARNGNAARGITHTVTLRITSLEPSGKQICLHETRGRAVAEKSFICRRKTTAHAPARCSAAFPDDATLAKPRPRFAECEVRSLVLFIAKDERLLKRR